MINKISLYLTVFALMLGFASCSDDNTPAYHEPTGTMVLNTPPFAAQTYVLQPDGMMTFTVEQQPDYGFLASVNYGLEVSLDKTNVQEVVPEVLTSQEIQVKESLISIALCTLNGIESSDDWNAKPEAQQPQPLYVRATCMIPGVESSLVKSEWITLSKVQPYFAVKEPGFIYLVGTPNGWPGPDEGHAADLAGWRLFESKTAIGSNIYTAVFDMPAAPIFRFYTQLSGWDGGDSMGSQENDSAIDYTLTDGQFQGKLVKGKGSFSFPEFAGGEMTIVVDLNDNTVQIMAGAQTVVDPKYIYLVGQPVGWSAPNEGNADSLLALVDKTDSGIYTATYTLEKDIDWFNFRFCRELAPAEAGDDAWNQVDWIGCPDGDNFEIDMPFEGSADDSQNTWRIMNASVGQTVKFTVNTATNPVTVKFETVE